MGTPRRNKAWFAWWVAGIFVVAALSNGCGSSRCSLNAVQGERLHQIQSTAKLISQSKDAFPEDYRTRAKEQLQQIEELKNPFLCSQRDAVTAKLNAVDVNVRMLSEAALPACLGRAGKLLRKLDALADQMTPDERNRYETERHVDPAALARLNGCIERVQQRTQLLDEVSTRLQNLPSFEAQVAAKVRDFRSLAETPWWRSMSLADLQKKYNDLVALAGQLRQDQQTKLYQELTDADNAAIVGYAKKLKADIHTATQQCDRQAFQDGLAALQKLPVGSGQAGDLEDAYDSHCGTEAGVRKLVEDIKVAFTQLQDALASPNIEEQDRAIQHFLDVVRPVPRSDTSKGRALTEHGVNVEMLNELVTFADHLLKSDQAVARGQWNVARSELKKAQVNELGKKTKLVPGRFARLDLAEGLWLERNGHFDQAWARLVRAGRVLSTRKNRARLAVKALQAARGDAAVLTWARRASSVDALAGAPPRALSAVVVAASRPGSTTEGLNLGLAALKALIANGRGTPGDTIKAAAGLLHRLTSSGTLSGSQAQALLDRLIAGSQASGNLQPAEAQALGNLFVFEEIAGMVGGAVNAVTEELSRLSSANRARLEKGVFNRLLQGAAASRLIVLAQLQPSRMGGRYAAFAARAQGHGGWAMSPDGRQVGLMVSTQAGPLLVVFEVPRMAGQSRAEMKARLRPAEAEALGVVAALRIEMISERTGLSVAERKRRVASLINGIRQRMRGVVLAYAGLFNRSGNLEVPENPHDFFLVPELKGQPDPVFQDSVSRKALETVRVQHQMYRIGRHHVEDVAVAVTRGRNRVGVLRLGVLIEQ